MKYLITYNEAKYPLLKKDTSESYPDIEYLKQDIYDILSELGEFTGAKNNFNIFIKDKKGVFTREDNINSRYYNDKMIDRVKNKNKLVHNIINVKITKNGRRFSIIDISDCINRLSKYLNTKGFNMEVIIDIGKRIWDMETIINYEAFDVSYYFDGVEKHELPKISFEVGANLTKIDLIITK